MTEPGVVSHKHSEAVARIVPGMLELASHRQSEDIIATRDAGDSAAVAADDLHHVAQTARDRLSAAPTEDDSNSADSDPLRPCVSDTMHGAGAPEAIGTRTLNARVKEPRKASFRRVMSANKPHQEASDAAGEGERPARHGSLSSRQGLRTWSTEPVSLTHRPSVGSLRRASTETPPGSNAASRRSSAETGLPPGDSSPQQLTTPIPRRASSGSATARRGSAECFVHYEPRSGPPSVARKGQQQAASLVQALASRVSGLWRKGKVHPDGRSGGGGGGGGQGGVVAFPGGFDSGSSGGSGGSGAGAGGELGLRRSATAGTISRTSSEASRSGLSAGELEIAALTEWNAMLKENYIGCTTATGDRLNQQMKGMRPAMSRASADSVLMTSSPVAAAACKPRFQLLFALVAAYMFYTGVSNISMTGALRYTRQYYALRFTALELRGGRSPSEHGPGVSRIGGMRTGRPVVDEGSRTEREGATLTVVYEEGVRLNGWWFVTTFDPVDFDPVRFRLEGCARGLSEGGCSGLGLGAEEEEDVAEEGEAREVTGGWEFVGSSSMDKEEEGWFETTRGRGRAQLFDFQAIIYTQIVVMAVPFALGLSFLGAAASGMFGYEVYAKWVVAAASVVALVLHVSSAALLLGQGLVESAQLGLMYSVCLLVFVLLLCCFERWVVQLSCILAGVLFLGEHTVFGDDIHDAVALGFGDQRIDSSLSTAWGAFLICFGVGIQAMRQYMLARSRIFILKDKRRYDAVWAELQQQAGAAEFLERLADKARALPRPGPRGGPQQVNSWRFHGRFSKKAPSPGTEPSHKERRPIHSLDQLFAQAAGLDIVLRKRVQEWAGASGGLFPLREEKKGYIEAQGEAAGQRGPEFVRWEEVWDDPELERRVRWAKVKSEGRAMEKLLRVYGGEVSRLVDVCRQSIVFESVPAMHACLCAIADDAEAEVVRVKNRMDPAYDSSLSAGYRDVMINLRINTPETRFLGIDAHICELQLILVRFAELKDDEGHRRYVRFRNARGE